MKRLVRPRQGRILGGVAAGLADYSNIDVALVRLVFVLLTIFGGLGVPVYFIAWIIMPEGRPDGRVTNKQFDERVEGVAHTMAEQYNENRHNANYIAGIILIGLGVIFLLDRWFEWASWSRLWPLILIGIGLLIVAKNIGQPTPSVKPKSSPTAADKKAPIEAEEVEVIPKATKSPKKER